MKQTLIDLITSKKFIAAISAIVIYVGGRFGTTIDPTVLDHIWQALLVYVGAQGIADIGKGAAQVQSPKPSSAPGGQAGRISLTMLLALGVLSAAIGGAVLIGCSTAGQRAVSGIEAGVSCEEPNLKAAAADLIPLALAELEHWISGSGQVDTTGLKADLAKIKSSAAQCAIDAAVAILTTPMPAKPGAPASAAMPVGDLRGAYAGIRAELGWTVR